ncbi:MAG TPA: hypothetical protein VK163_12930, partial [Opitutaceae bacterium]|nr:hypothetical protein [Opitutaceae bacterium]
GAGAKTAMAAGESPIQQLTTRLPELLDRSTGLIDFLLENSTDLTLKTIGELDAGVVAELVRIAIELNLDSEVKNSCAGIAAVVVGPVPALGTKSPTT